MKRRILGVVGLMAALAGTCGCGGGATVLDPTDAATPDDRSDAADAAAPISDSTPRVVPLLGTANIVLFGPTEWRERSTLYLPDGWHAGAGAWLDLQFFTFDADGVGHPTCHLTNCTLTLDPSDGCAHFHYDRAESPAGDVIYIIDGDLVACDDGVAAPLPTATLTATVPNSDRVGLVAPLPASAIAARTATPIDTSTAALALLRVDGSNAAATVTATPGQITLTPLLSLRVGAAVTVALAGVLDVMGRAFAEPGALQTRNTTDVVSDLTFGVAPPAGAVSAGGATVSLTSGSLCLGGRFPSCITPSDYPLGVALALADPGSSTLLSLALLPVPERGIPVFAAVARADGTTGTAVELTAPGGDVPIPAGTGPIWLLLYATEQASDRCPTGPDVPSICIDSIVVH